MAHILVVDDEHNIRMMIRLALQHAGHEVETASDGSEALDKFGDGTKWELVLLDQRMPGLEGLTVLKQMRYHSPAARVVMITAFGTIDLAVEAMKAGATDFLRKPFTAETLRGAVDTALERASPHAASSADASSSLTFCMTTVNGFRLESKSGPPARIDENLAYLFMVRTPEKASVECTVVLSRYVMELVKAHTDRDAVPGGARFWQAVCEEALANYLYQNAAPPPDGILRVDEFTTGLRRWVDAVLTGEHE